MKELTIRLIDGLFVSDNISNNQYHLMSKNQFVNYFLPTCFTYKFVSNDDNADICIIGIGFKDIDLLRKNEINIMICVENCNHWNWYDHYNKYGNYGNDIIDIYIYNHIDKLYIEPTNKFIAIPTVYCRINYYNMIKSNLYKDELSCSFENKKFCLMINKSNLNKNINSVYNKLLEYGQVDHISIYNNEIQNASCYNSLELLKVFNKYKFIICFENSYNDGYITEKIFNCFLAKTIPVYQGSKIIESFFNKDSFINIPIEKIEDFDYNNIKVLSENEYLYNEMLYKEKINSLYNEENYMNIMIDKIKFKLNF